jgi:guanidinoacetate N-methyltransferase
MKKIRRDKDYEISIEIKSDSFIRPPRDPQRNWILNRLLKEVADDMGALHKLAESFVPGAEPMDVNDRDSADLKDDEIMENWQIPVMQEMAKVACESHGDILEIGFGRGISSEFIQELGVKSHTIVECNEAIIKRFDTWKESWPDRDIRLIKGRWQDSVELFEKYDGVFFHTYPLSSEELVQYVTMSATFAEHFFDTAAAHLNPGGVFTYLTNEIDSLSRAHQRALFKRFRSVGLKKLENLGVPEDTRDAQWAQEIIIVRAEK